MYLTAKCNFLDIIYNCIQYKADISLLKQVLDRQGYIIQRQIKTPNLFVIQYTLKARQQFYFSDFFKR